MNEASNDRQSYANFDWKLDKQPRWIRRAGIKESTESLFNLVETPTRELRPLVNLATYRAVILTTTSLVPLGSEVSLQSLMQQMISPQIHLHWAVSQSRLMGLCRCNTYACESRHLVSKMTAHRDINQGNFFSFAILFKQLDHNKCDDRDESLITFRTSATVAQWPAIQSYLEVKGDRNLSLGQSTGAAQFIRETLSYMKQTSADDISTWKSMSWKGVCKDS